MCAERSTSVSVKRAFRWYALLPPPLPSSRTSRAEPSSRAISAASSAYSSFGEISGHHVANSP